MLYHGNRMAKLAYIVKINRRENMRVNEWIDQEIDGETLRC